MSKDNTSASIVHYQYGEGRVRMAIVGYDDNEGIIEDIDMEQVTFYPGDRMEVNNWILENGLGQACLRGEAMDDNTIYADGWWSPDSVE